MDLVEIQIKYRVKEQFLIGSRSLSFPSGVDEHYLTKLLKQPFSLKVLFPESTRISLNNLSLKNKGEVNAEFGTSECDNGNGNEWKIQLYYMIEGKLSRTNTGLEPLRLVGLERGDVWRMIESELFKEYIYSEMVDKLPPDAKRHCVKLIELSLEYGELLFSIQRLK